MIERYLNESNKESVDSLLDRYLTEDGEAVTSLPGTTDKVATYVKRGTEDVLTRQLRKKNKETTNKIKSQAKKDVSESKAITTQELVDAFGGDKVLKKFASYSIAWAYVKKNISKLTASLGVAQKDLPMASLETYIKHLFTPKKG